jgi:hypothetical protein
MRSIVTMLIQHLANAHFISHTTNKILRILIIFFTMILADLATYIYKPQGTTMRGNPYPNYIPKSITKLHNMFYSLSQIFATLVILTQIDIGRLFILLIPIQTAPFGMTLVKKGITNQLGWHFFYTGTLLLNYITLPLLETVISRTELKLLAVFFATGRFYFNMNKYFLWSLVCGYIMMCA